MPPLNDLIIIAKDILEIVVLWVIFYRILLFFEGTRAFQVLKGILYLIIALVLSKVLQLDVLNWLLSNFFSIWIVVIVVIFAHEIRAGLARLGQQHLFTVALAETELEAVIAEIADSVYKFSQRRTGCLIAIEREMKLNMYIDSGITVDAKVSSALVQSIFLSNSPLHDGGVIVRNDRIAATSCLFPLSENPTVNKTVGTRHRAALGLSEHTDALIILVSEETGDVSLAFDSRLVKVNDEEHFSQLVKELLSSGKKDS